jgi:Domain of unknown function (DUF4405)
MIMQKQIAPTTKTKTRDRTRLNLFLDIGLTLFFVIEMEDHFTGLALHEWLGVFFAAVLVIHVVLHWDWVVSITRTFFYKLVHESRLNYVLNAVLLVDVIVVTVTGIAVSETLGLNFGLSGATLTDWQTVHAFSSHLCLVLTALHVALHWKWVATNVVKHLFRLPTPGRKVQPESEATS